MRREETRVRQGTRKPVSNLTFNGPHGSLQPDCHHHHHHHHHQHYACPWLCMNGDRGRAWQMRAEVETEVMCQSSHFQPSHSMQGGWLLDGNLHPLMLSTLMRILLAPFSQELPLTSRVSFASLNGRTDSPALMD